MVEIPEEVDSRTAMCIQKCTEKARLQYIRTKKQKSMTKTYDMCAEQCLRGSMTLKGFGATQEFLDKHDKLKKEN